ncbi:MAG: YicC family protein [Bacteroidetes bacterium]|nr:YicC family protein [Bacteroidota bacterium]
MIKSMTGYASATKQNGEKSYSAEIKSLNSKTFDLSIKLPSGIKEDELVLRKELSSILVRGKITISVMIDPDSETQPVNIDHELAKKYFSELKKLAADVGSSDEDLLRISLQLPNVIKRIESEPDNQEWQMIKDVIHEATKIFDKYRREEGDSIKQDLKSSIQDILDHLKKIEEEEPNRLEEIRSRINGNLEKFLGEDEIDQNRFEQELLYFIEKMDFTEEKNRLRTHCDFFLKVMEEEEVNGKKLNFISQEMGREINTLGSKANSAIIQHLTVQMKDDLEKIKEQVLNVL